MDDMVSSSTLTKYNQEINELPMRMMPQLSRGSPLVRERTLHNLTGRHATDEAGKKLKGESLSGFLSFRRNRRAR